MSSNLDIAKAFLENAPPGEYEQCTFALRSIVPDEEIVDQARSETIQSWSEKECLAVQVNDHKAIVCKEARYGEDKYVDPVTGNVFQYDFESRVVMETGETVDSSDFVKQLQEKISKYCEKSYKEDAVSGVYANSDGTISIILSSRSLSLKNFRTGKTVAKYVLSEDGSLKGKIESVQHFFEKGNAVCQHDGECDKNATFGDAASVVKAISRFEEEWLSSYKETLEKIGSDILFRLRRKFPVSKTKINWLQEVTVGGGMQH